MRVIYSQCRGLEAVCENEELDESQTSQDEEELVKGWMH